MRVRAVLSSRRAPRASPPGPRAPAPSAFAALGRGLAPARARAAAALVVAAAALPVGALGGGRASAQEGGAPPPAAPPIPIAGGRAVENELRKAAVYAEAGRWDEAARLYVELLRRQIAPASGVESVVPDPALPGVWRSAAGEARERLLAWPSEGRAAFRRAFDAEARAAFDAARAARDEGRLDAVVRTYPLASAAYEAWDVLADLALERGELGLARRRYQSAVDALARTDPTLNPRRLEAKLALARTRDGGAQLALATPRRGEAAGAPAATSPSADQPPPQPPAAAAAAAAGASARPPAAGAPRPEAPSAPAPATPTAPADARPPSSLPPAHGIEVVRGLLAEGEAGRAADVARAILESGQTLEREQLQELVALLARARREESRAIAPRLADPPAPAAAAPAGASPAASAAASLGPIGPLPARGVPSQWPTTGGGNARWLPLGELPGLSRSAVSAEMPATYTGRSFTLRQGSGPRVRSSSPAFSDRFPDVLPSIADGRVVLASDGSIACHDLRSGAVLWRQRLWAGREAATPLVPGAATIADGRVFASFIHTATRAKSYHGTIPITESIPTRRLVAFDLATGKRLWDQKDLGDPFLAAVSVALPPVERGGVLYATGVLVQGALKAYALALDAATGALIWRRFLGDGQVELTMFGNQAVEPLHMMPVEAEGTVYVCTALGLAAALDARTGEIRWLRAYDSIPIQAARSYYAIHRDIPWRTVSPLVAGGVFVVAPLDASAVYAFDAATGALRWRVERGDERRLLGLHGDRVAIQGSRLRLFDLASGKLVQVAPAGARGRLLEPEIGQGLIAGDEALVPMRGEVHRFDLRRGEALAPFALEGYEGPGEPSGSLVYVRGRLVLANPVRFTAVGIEAGY